MATKSISCIAPTSSPDARDVRISGGAGMTDSQIALVYRRDWASNREQLCCRSRTRPGRKGRIYLARDDAGQVRVGGETHTHAQGELHSF